jgi:hypothetical protein
MKGAVLWEESAQRPTSPRTLAQVIGEYVTVTAAQ